MTQETQTARVHFELVSHGFEVLPVYEYELCTDPSRHNGSFVATASLRVRGPPGYPDPPVLTATGEPAATKQYAKSNAAESLLVLVKATLQLEPLVERSGLLPRPVRPGFLVPKPVVQFGPGEVKDMKDLVRGVGVAYLRAALAFYEVQSTNINDPPEPACSDSCSLTTKSVAVTSSSVGESQPVSNDSDSGRVPQRSGSGISTPDECLSRIMVNILRHRTRELGLEVDGDGFVDAAQLMRHLPRRYNISDVADVTGFSVHRDGSSRFHSICKSPGEHLYVRANRKVTSNPLQRTITIDPNRRIAV